MATSYFDRDHDTLTFWVTFLRIYNYSYKVLGKIIIPKGVLFAFQSRAEFVVAMTGHGMQNKIETVKW